MQYAYKHQPLKVTKFRTTFFGSETHTNKAMNNVNLPSLSASTAPAALLKAAYDNDGTVNRMLRNNEPLEQIINVLVREKQLAQKIILDLESIAPRKIKMPDGTVMLWHCPVELIPTTELRSPLLTSATATEPD